MPSCSYSERSRAGSCPEVVPQPGRRPPDLAGPSPSGIGLAPDQVPAYRAWVDVSDWNVVVRESRIALADALGGGRGG
jgi:hypothetical protein